MIVTGEGPSISVREIREPVTVTLSKLVAPLAEAGSSTFSSAFWAHATLAAGSRIAANSAALKRVRFGAIELRTGMRESPNLFNSDAAWHFSCRAAEVKSPLTVRT
jgi:hypothetical protein